MPYALIQKSLDQRIDRQTLEEISVHVPNVARADCARIHRDLFGVVVTHLPYDQAVAFQTALAHYQFPTDIIPQEDLPTLTPPKFRRGIRFSPGSFTSVDGLGREENYLWEDAQFAAGGFVEARVRKTKNVLEWDYYTGPRSTSGKTVQVRTQEEEGKEKEFRLEIFLSREPYRLQFQAGQETVFRFDNAMLRAHQEDQLEEILRRVGRILPGDCLNQGIQKSLRLERYLYPSSSGFEEEITWHLYHRLRG